MSKIKPLKLDAYRIKTLYATLFGSTPNTEEVIDANVTDIASAGAH